MIRILKIFAVILLLFNGIGAIYGGGNLILHPDGSTLGLPLHLLDGTPFSNYAIPGVVLILANGILSLLTAAFVLLKTPHFKCYILAQGCILLGWLFIQVLLIKMLFFLHYVMGAVGLLLVICGVLLFWYHKPGFTTPAPVRGHS